MKTDWRRILVVVGAGALLAGIVAVLVLKTSKEGPPLAGAFARFVVEATPAAAPAVTLTDAAGAAVALSDFRGRVVVLNFWATWCQPCLKEMPSLDRLAAALSDEPAAIVALSIDREGMALAVPFFAKLGLTRLKPYVAQADPMAAARLFGVDSLPTTVIIDAEGRIAGRLVGDAEWDSPEALALIRYYTPKASPGV